MLDWIANPVREILPLIPLIRDSREEINPPEGSFFVLRVGSEYFSHFHCARPGPCTSFNVANARRLDSLVIVATFAVFIVRDFPALKEKLFVEVIRKNGASVPVPIQPKLKARAVGA
jgi:hypothetical protein